jgi:antitoxin ParD1/3/4
VQRSLVRAFIFEYIEYTKEQKDRVMARAPTTTMTVRLSGPLSDFVAANVGEHGSYENVSEYVRDLIRRDKEHSEKAAFERLRAELAHAYGAPESAYKPLTANDVIARNRR